MNTFTFTDDELELLIELVVTADDGDQEQLVILSQLSKVLNRKTCISFSEQVPETFDQSGFEALKFTEVGSATDYGDLDPTKEK